MLLIRGLEPVRGGWNSIGVWSSIGGFGFVSLLSLVVCCVRGACKLSSKEVVLSLLRLVAFRFNLVDESVFGFVVVVELLNR